MIRRVNEWNPWICLCNETVILSVVGGLMNLTLGCKDIKWSDDCLVLLVNLSIQLFTALICTLLTDHELDH